MQAAWIATALLALVFIGVHVAVSARNGYHIPHEVRDAIGGSPGTTLTRGWAHFVSPFFHHTPTHLIYNVAVLVVVMPFALEAMGVARGLALAYVASPLATWLVHGLIAWPLALTMGFAGDASVMDARGVGGSLIVFAGGGMALATRGWPTSWVAAVFGVYILYEFVLTAAGATGRLVPFYHLAALTIGVVWVRLFGVR